MHSMYCMMTVLDFNQYAPEIVQNCATLLKTTIYSYKVSGFVTWLLANFWMWPIIGYKSISVFRFVFGKLR